MANKGPTFAEAFGVTIAQPEADFVVPNLSSDIPVCIDPFLLYKSRDPVLQQFHGQLVGLFKHAFDLHRAGDRRSLDRLIDFPEVNAIAFGYTRGGIQGSGLGLHLNRLLVDLLEANEAVRSRGLRHIEELQLLSVGVGPDRVSDITANVLKAPLIEYTQLQCEIWHISLQRNAPVPHFFDETDMEWRDGYFDLPLNPVTGLPLIFVPRRMVRLLPWINYPDFYSTDAQLLLPPRSRLPRYPGMPKEKRLEVAKAEMVAKVRESPAILDAYIGRKERDAAAAAPLLPDDRDNVVLRTVGGDLLVRLAAVPSGAAHAAEYQRLVYEILNFLFEPDLSAGKLEVSTYLGTERRDIIYWNEAERSFWAYARSTYLSPLIMFEVKNVTALELEHVNQTATYLGARLGMLGFIVTRRPASEAISRKAFSVYNNSPALPRKTMLVLSDDDMVSMIEDRLAERLPTGHVQDVYRRFRSRVQ